MAANDLSGDEMTVLGITAMGESLAPIGRWSRPCKSLADRGYLKALDPHNYVITPAGKEAFEAEDKRVDHALLGQMVSKSNQIGAEQQSIRDTADKMAHQLVTISRLSSKITGDAPADAAQRWAHLICKRALDLLNE